MPVLLILALLLGSMLTTASLAPQAMVVGEEVRLALLVASLLVAAFLASLPAGATEKAALPAAAVDAPDDVGHRLAEKALRVPAAVAQEQESAVSPPVEARLVPIVALPGGQPCHLIWQPSPLREGLAERERGAMLRRVLGEVNRLSWQSVTTALYVALPADWLAVPALFRRLVAFAAEEGPHATELVLVLDADPDLPDALPEIPRSLRGSANLGFALSLRVLPGPDPAEVGARGFSRVLVPADAMGAPATGTGARRTARPVCEAFRGRGIAVVVTGVDDPLRLRVALDANASFATGAMFGGAAGCALSETGRSAAAVSGSTASSAVPT